MPITTMKIKYNWTLILLLLMVFLSLFVGINADDTYFALYKFEFIGLIQRLKESYSTEKVWRLGVALFMSHFLICCLPFIYKTKFFNLILIVSPIIFTTVYFFIDPFSIILLIPFLFIWFICLIRMRKYRFSHSET